VIVIDGKLIAKKRNTIHSEFNWASHAEANLLRENSNVIKKRKKDKKKVKVELYTTLEPCLMCLGSAVLHRVTRIVYACPDPFGGAAKINPKNLTKWYERKWPKISFGLYKKESYEMVINFLKNNFYDTKFTKEFEKIGKNI